MNFNDKVFITRLLNTEILRLKRKRNYLDTKHRQSHKYEIALINIDILHMYKIKTELQKDLLIRDPDSYKQSSSLEGGAP